MAELEGPLSGWLNEGNERAQRALRRNEEEWCVGSAERYFFDQDTGVLTFTFPERTVSTPFQFLGSYSSRSGTWMWAWALESVDAPLKRDSLALVEAGRRAGSALLTEPIVEVSAQDADCLALLALRESRFDGVYKAPDGPSVAYLSFGAPIPA
ncbi:MAG: DUF6882 domain-containing protein [Dermatophilaceae bacterium]|nr:hypothetical protein [Intrasporangiaceae bacterium]